MSNCYSGDNIAGDHIHTGITTCNIEEPQQRYRLGTVSNRSLEGWGGGAESLYFTGSESLLFANVEGSKYVTFHVHFIIVSSC